MSDSYLCHIDLETSGLLNFRHGIVQIGYILEVIPQGQVSGQVLCEREIDLLVFPKDEVDLRACQVNGTTEDEVRGSPNRLQPKDGLKLFLSDLRTHFGSNRATMVGFNLVRFDEPFLRKFFQKCGKTPYWSMHFYTPCIDVLVLLGHLMRFKRPEFQARLDSMGTDGKFKQKNFLEVFPKELAEMGYTKSGDLHRALEDTRLSRALYKMVSTQTLW